MRKQLTISLSLIAAASAYGQSDLLGLPVSAYLDNVADSTAVQSGAKTARPGLLGVEEGDRFFSKRRFSISYAYVNTERDSRGVGIDDSTHSAVPELYLETGGGFAVNLGVDYSHRTVDVDGWSFADTDWNSYGVSLQPAQELWRFISDDDQAPQLWLGFGFGYRRMESDEVTFPGIIGEIKTEADTFFISPNLVFTRKITDRFIAMIAPAYTMQWVDSETRGSDSEAEAGVFTLTGRGDFALTEAFTLTGYATWKRDVHMDVDFPGFRPEYESWAEFGGSLRFAVGESIGLRVGYAYETFHPEFDAHKALARFELGF